jgi:hypothetical protein
MPYYFCISAVVNVTMTFNATKYNCNKTAAIESFKFGMLVASALLKKYLFLLVYFFCLFNLILLYSLYCACASFSLWNCLVYK